MMPARVLVAAALLAAAPPLVGQHDADAPARPEVAAPAEPSAGWSILTTPADDAGRERLVVLVEQGRQTVEAFFDEPFGEPVVVNVHPDRAAFTASFPEEWGLTQTDCWMVAYGVADRLSLLSPRVWASEACEHDPDDELHVQLIVTHEIVHAFHGQANPTRDFTGIEEDVGWFAEGLATYASGQLAERHRSQAAQALAAGAGPRQLTSAWSGPWRYGVCGSLVAFFDARVGRAGLRRMLAATSLPELLEETGLDETELLAAWEAWVLESERGGAGDVDVDRVNR